MLDVQKWKQMSMEDLANHIPVVIMAAAVLAGIIAYVLYIVNGGYSAQIADIKEYGFLSDRMFTTGTTDLVLGGIAGNIILLLLLAEFVVLSLAYCRICEEGKKTALIASGVLILVQIAAAFVIFWIRIGRVTVEPRAVQDLIFNFPEVIMYVKPVGIIYTILTVGALLVFWGLLLIEKESREMVIFTIETSVYKGYKQDKIEMRGDRAEMSDFPLYLNTVAGGLDCRDQTIGGFSFVVKIYALPVVEIIG